MSACFVRHPWSSAESMIDGAKSSCASALSPLASTAAIAIGSGPQLRDILAWRANIDCERNFSNDIRAAGLYQAFQQSE